MVKWKQLDDDFDMEQDAAILAALEGSDLKECPDCGGALTGDFYYGEFLLQCVECDWRE